MMFRPKGWGSTGVCRNHCNEELYAYCSSTDIIKVTDQMNGDKMDRGGEKIHV
jgi:hypothetical protein